MTTNRRGFLKWLGIGAGAAVAAPVLATLPEVKETWFQGDFKTIRSPNWLGKYDETIATIGEYGGWMDESFNAMCRQAKATKERILWEALTK